jgi:hypothetical protein
MFFCSMVLCYAECRYAEFCFAECRYAECLNSKCRYAECSYAQCCHAEYRYSVCRYAECHGATFTIVKGFITLSSLAAGVSLAGG